MTETATKATPRWGKLDTPKVPPAPWKPPPRRAYKPKPLDPGQPVTWVLSHHGHYETSNGERRYDAADHTWIEGAEVSCAA